LKKVIFAIFLWLNYCVLYAQEYPHQEINIRDFLQNLVGNPQTDNVEDLYESLFQLYLNPLDLNRVSREELSALYLLSPTQLNAFFEYRKNSDNLLSIYELQSIPDFDLPTIYRIIPFVKVGQAFSLNPDFSEANHSLLLRYSQVLETKKGFTEPDSRSKVRYQGSVGKLYTRYKFYSRKDFSLGFTTEKDEGEKNYADFSSFHLQIQNKGHLKNLLIGDYLLQFGQGLITSAGFNIGKGSETVLTVRRSHLGIRPYSSAMEMNFFRGAATTYQFGNLEVTGFYSGIKRDANLIFGKDNNPTNASSLQTSGLHRTLSEQQDFHSLREHNIGTDITYRNPTGNLMVGLTALQTNFDIPLQKTDKPYNLYEFKGNQNFLAGLHYSWSLRNYNFFGETARSQSGGWGTVNGFLASFGKKTDIAVLFRNYDKDFHSFYANSFAESSRNINEIGLYGGIKYYYSPKILISGYLDYFRFKWFKFGLDKQPSEGFDGLIRGQYQINKYQSFFVQYREEHKEENTKEAVTIIVNNKPRTDEITVVKGRVRRQILANFDWKYSSILRFQTRASYSQFKFAGQAFTQGFAIAQDVELDLGKFSLSGRVAIFNTEDYDNRQYFYENDVLYAFSYPAYYNHGMRFYAVAQYKLTKNSDIWLKISRTKVTDSETIGSGLEEISVPYRTEGKFQVRLHF
jgi:hypothetical protein